MSIFGWRLTNKPIHVESERVKALKLALAEAQYQERERSSNQVIKDKRQAIVHLKAAERYFESMQLATGARVSELKAIVDSRLEKARQLGFELKGSITQTIQRLS